MYRGIKEFWFLGERFTGRTGVDLARQFFRGINGLDPQFLIHLATSEAAGSRSRRFLALRPEDLYPNSPHLVHLSEEIVPGIWLATNYSKAGWVRVFRDVCKYLGWTWRIHIDVVLDGSATNAT